MRWRIPAYLLLTFLALSACRFLTSPAENTTPNTSSNPTPGQPTADFQYIFDAPSNPIQVSITPDESRSASATIPVEGGVLSTTAADGTIFTLEIPGDALLNETTITLTPIAAVSGLPFGGEQTYSAKLAPEGLFFNNFVTLTIHPAQEIPLDQQVFFGFREDGKELTLAPPVVSSSEIKILLLHFSGAGVTKGLLADTAPVRARLGGGAETRLQSAAAEYLSRERQKQLLGSENESGLGEKLAELMREFQEQVVKPRIAAAGESCAAGRLALQTVLGLERQRQLLGITDDEGTFSGEIGQLMDTVARVCMQEEYELCAEQHIIHRMVPVWLGMERQYQLLGLTEGGAAPEVLNLARDLTQKCLTFELVFESDGNFDAGEGDGYESVVRAKVTLRFNPDELKITGQSALVNESFEFRAEDCRVTNNRGGSTFEALSLVYISDTHSPTDELGYVRDFKLTYWPGNTSESFSITCDDSSYTSPPTGFWSAIFLVLHYSELDAQGADVPPPVPDFSGAITGGAAGVPVFAMPQMPAGAGYLATDWEVTGGEYYAKKEWIKEMGDLGLVESGTLKLYHRPGG